MKIDTFGDKPWGFRADPPKTEKKSKGLSLSVSTLRIPKNRISRKQTPMQANRGIRSVNMKKTIGIIGFGNMGSCIGEQLRNKYQVSVFDKDEQKTQDLVQIRAVKSIEDLVKEVEVVILAAKPQDFDGLLSQIKKFIRDKLVISIAAGIPTEYIEKQLGRVPVIRTMPNLPVKVGKGMVCLCKGEYATDADLEFARELFLNMGSTLLIYENMMDPATAISGSGPGFLYAFFENKPESDWPDFINNKFIPQLSESAIELGFNQEEANILAERTVNGSLALLEQTGLTAQELCSQVSSKGGTTEAGLKELDVNDIESLSAATGAALSRVKELSR